MEDGEGPAQLNKGGYVGHLEGTYTVVPDEVMRLRKVSRGELQE